MYIKNKNNKNMIIFLCNALRDTTSTELYIHNTVLTLRIDTNHVINYISLHSIVLKPSESYKGQNYIQSLSGQTFIRTLLRS